MAESGDRLSWPEDLAYFVTVQVAA